MSDEPRMTGMDKKIFNTTRTLTSLLNDACNHWNYLCPYLERLAVVADDALRGYQKDYPEQVAELIDCQKREREPVGNPDTLGNAAAMREALARIENLADDYEQCGTKAGALDSIHELACAALAAPPRNCDVGTAEEQNNRFRKFCEKYPFCEGCKMPGRKMLHDIGGTKCVLAWSQMPYAAEEGAGK